MRLGKTVLGAFNFKGGNQLFNMMLSATYHTRVCIHPMKMAANGFKA